jgi:hypothetical protein
MNGYLNRARSVLSTLTLVLCASAALTGCKSGGGESGGSVTSPASIPVTPTGPVSNSAPTISGTAIANVAVSTPYSFSPTASDADGDALTFQIQNKPAWATFNTVNGTLSGTPTAAGTHSNIIISATDGKATASLAAFAITVTTAQSQTAAATVSWTAPTQNTDGSQLTDLAGYVIVYGQSSTELTQSVQIANPSVDTYVFDQLTKGTTYYFAIRAFTAGGTESNLSSVVSKTI